MDQDWGDWDDGDSGFSGDADTADLGGPDEPSASGLGGYEDQGGYPAGDAGADPGTDPAPGSGGGFLEDDPMGGFGDAGADSDFGADADGPGHEGLTDAGSVDLTEAGDLNPETVVGADPDVDPDADWAPADFPAQLEFAAPEPVDGYPWADPAAVAAPGSGGDDPAHSPDAAAPARDLLDYAGSDYPGSEGGGDPWAALIGSDDPATSTLGRWWSPGG